MNIFFLQCFLPALLYISLGISILQQRAFGVLIANYITGIKIYNLPIEEVLFFFVIPYCCVFIYQCIKTYFPNLKNKSGGDVILITIGLLLWIAGIIFHAKHYTSWDFYIECTFYRRHLFSKKPHQLFLMLPLF
ncbi:MAG: lycopene cyclase domain-containing protein [Ferruginibacter sp.]